MTSSAMRNRMNTNSIDLCYRALEGLLYLSLPSVQQRAWRSKSFARKH